MSALCTWYSLLEAESTPGHMELSDATGKTPATPGIDPGTFRLVAQCLNNYATPGPTFMRYLMEIYIPRSFILAGKLGFTSVDTRTLRVTGLSY